MSSKTNPFSPFLDMDPAKFDFTKMLSGLQLPGLDTDALMAAQRKNIEALTEANQLAVAGMQAVAKRQSEIMAEAIAAAAAAAQRLSGTRDPGELAAQQAEIAQDALEKGLANMRELAEVFSKSAKDAVGVVGKRVVEGLGEAKNVVSKK
jgi:phasin family protein